MLVFTTDLIDKMLDKVRHGLRGTYQKVWWKLNTLK